MKLKLKKVQVQWIDSCGGDCYWALLKDFKPSITKPTTFGFVIYEDDEIISVAQSYAEGDDEVPSQINGVINIPKVAILELTEMVE